VELLGHHVDLKELVEKAKQQSMTECTIRVHIPSTTDEPPTKKSRGDDKTTSSSKTVKTLKANAAVLSLDSPYFKQALMTAEEEEEGEDGKVVDVELAGLERG